MPTIIDAEYDNEASLIDLPAWVPRLDGQAGRGPLRYFASHELDASTRAQLGSLGARQLSHFLQQRFAHVQHAVPVTGCAQGAKNSLDKNYLHLAQQHGADILAEQEVTDVRPIGKPDGSVDLGPLQWLGSAASQKCMTEEAVKARLPPYNGPTVTWLWSVGNTAHPAPGPLSPPAGYPERLAEQTRALQGQSSAGLATPHSPLAACPLRSPNPDAFASVVARLFVFPDGRVAGATPIAAAYDGQEPVFLDCAMDLVRAWQFPPFTGPGFTMRLRRPRSLSAPGRSAGFRSFSTGSSILPRVLRPASFCTFTRMVSGSAGAAATGRSVRASIDRAMSRFALVRRVPEPASVPPDWRPPGQGRIRPGRASVRAPAGRQ